MSESLIKSGSFANLLKADRAVFLNFSLVYLLDFEKDIKFEFFFLKFFTEVWKKTVRDMLSNYIEQPTYLL